MYINSELDQALQKEKKEKKLKKKIPTRKQFEKDKKKARLDAFLRQVNEVFKERKFLINKPRNIIIDKGGIYLTDKKPGDKAKTFIIIAWVANNQMKEYILSFNDHADAIEFTKAFKKKFYNTRIMQAVK